MVSDFEFAARSNGNAYPWLCRVEIDALDTLGARKQLSLVTGVLVHALTHSNNRKPLLTRGDTYLDVESHLGILGRDLGRGAQRLTGRGNDTTPGFARLYAIDQKY